MTTLGILSIWQGDERFDRPFGVQTPLFEAITHAGKISGLVTHVYVPQETEQKEKLKVYSFIEGTWTSTFAPMPNVVYDRIPTRKADSEEKVVLFRQFLLKKTQGRLFNRAGFFSKSYIYSTIKSALPKSLQLPDTELLPDPSKIMKLVNLWGEAWLKPDDGSLGAGIYRINKEPFGITVESSDEGSVEHLEPEAAAELFSKLLVKKKYILQQGIQKADKNNRPFDIRVYLQKDQSGRFVVTKQFAKIIDFGQIVSNLHAGGDSAPLAELLSKMESSKLRKLSLACANRLNELIPQPLGEIALDLIIDPSRRFWVIEFNSKPLLKMEPGSAITAKTAARIVGYANYLLKQTNNKKLNNREKQAILQPKLQLSLHVSKGRRV